MPKPAEPPDEREVVEEFVTSARAFCRVVERRDWPSVGEFARAVRETLTRVYAAAAALPSPEPTADERVGERDGTPWSDVAETLTGLLAEEDAYLRVDDDGQIGSGFLAMDLSDIRADLDLSVRAIGEEAPAAILEARFAFETHWGAHAAAALAPLHALAQQH